MFLLLVSAKQKPAARVMRAAGNANLPVGGRAD